MSIRHDQGGRLIEWHLLGDRYAVRCLGGNLLRHAAPNAPCDHPIAGADTRYILSDAFYHPGHFAAWRKWARWPKLVFVFDNKRVGKVDATAFRSDQHLVRARHGVWHLGHNQRFRSTNFSTQQSSH